jgi:hypothetical protein
VLITCCVLVLLGTSANLLLRTGHIRAIAPVAGAIVGAALLVSAAQARMDAPLQTPVVVQPAPALPAEPPAVYAQPAPPAAPVAPEEFSCSGYVEPLGPAAGPIPAAAPGRHHPPFQISGLPGGAGPVVRSPRTNYGGPSAVLDTIGNALVDYDAHYYVMAADSSRLYFHLEVATPRAGDCALQLVYTALRGVDGMRTQRIMTLLPGPALARHRAVLACGLSNSGSGLSACAWASTVGGREPLFGAIWIFPTYQDTGFAEHQMSEAEIVAFVDKVFTAVDG